MVTLAAALWVAALGSLAGAVCAREIRARRRHGSSGSRASTRQRAAAGSRPLLQWAGSALGPSKEARFARHAAVSKAGHRRRTGSLGRLVSSLGADFSKPQAGPTCGGQQQEGGVSTHAVLIHWYPQQVGQLCCRVQAQALSRMQQHFVDHLPGRAARNKGSNRTCTTHCHLRCANHKQIHTTHKSSMLSQIHTLQAAATQAVIPLHTAHVVSCVER